MGEGCRREETSEGVCVRSIESAGAPEEVADVHEEAVEVRDGVFVRGPSWRLLDTGRGDSRAGEDGLECDLVGCKHRAEARESGNRRVSECEKVDC